MHKNQFPTQIYWAVWQPLKWETLSNHKFVNRCYTAMDSNQNLQLTMKRGLSAEHSTFTYTSAQLTTASNLTSKSPPPHKIAHTRQCNHHYCCYPKTWQPCNYFSPKKILQNRHNTVYHYISCLSTSEMGMWIRLIGIQTTAGAGMLHIHTDLILSEACGKNLSRIKSEITPPQVCTLIQSSALTEVRLQLRKVICYMLYHKKDKDIWIWGTAE